MRTVFIILFFLELVLVSYVAAFGLALQQTILSATKSDSVWLHVAAFIVMALTAFSIWGQRWTITVGLVVLAIVLEAVHLVIPNRTASIQDGLASSSGIALGWVGFLLYRRFLARTEDLNSHNGQG